MPQQVLHNIQQIFDTFSFGILIEDNQRRILYTNKRFHRIFGIPEQTNLSGLNCLEAAAASINFFEDGERFIEDIERIPLQAEAHEEIIASADGRYFRRKYDPVFEQGLVIAHIWAYEETTELTLKEKELIRERNFFHTILNEIPADIAIFSPDHRYLFLNQTAVKDPTLRRWMIGKDDFDYCRERNLDTVKAETRRQLFEEAKHTKQPVSWIDELERKDGKTNYVLRIFYPYLAANGSLELMIGYGININDQKSKEEELKQQRNRFLRFIETLSEGVIQFSAEGKILFHNERMLQLLHLDKSKLEGASIGRILTCSVCARPIFRSFLKLRRDGRMQTGVCAIKNSDSELFVAYSIWKSDPEMEEITYFCKIQDITGQVVHEQQMQSVIEKEKELSSLKSHFIHITSHELRTPLSVILSSAEILDMMHKKAEGLQGLDPATFSSSIVREVHRITTILNELLMIGRIEHGKIKFEPAYTDLTSLIGDLCKELFSPYRDGRSVRMIFPEAPVSAFIDANLIKHAMSNLLDNAFKYSGGCADPELQIFPTEAAIEIRISDKGIGIPKEERDQLFQSFYRASNVGNISGTGLGLMVVEHVARLHHASLHIESVPGHGTHFFFTIPAKQV
jgi:signal transduction histidine kinase